MFWNSIPLMAAIDITIAVMAVWSTLTAYRYRTVLAELGVFPSMTAIVAGLVVISVLYLGDLVTMTVLPQLVGREAAMAAMRELHLNWNWPVMLVGVAGIVAGLLHLLHRLLPQTAAIVQDQQLEVERRLAAERSLDQSRVQLQELIDALPVLIGYVDKDHRWRLNNEAYERWTGRPRDELVGAHVREGLGEAAYESIRPYMEQALSGETVTFEVAVPYAYGGERYVKATYIPDVGTDGEVAGYFSTIVDISELKQAQDALALARDELERRVEERTAELQLANQALSESERRTRSINDSLPVVIAQVDKNLRYRYVNKTLLDRHGLTRDDVIGRSVSEVIGASAFETLRPAIERALSGETAETETVVTYGNAGQRLVDATYVPDLDEQGEVRGFLAHIIDLTDERKAQEALGDSEQRFRDFAESSSDWFWETDAENHIVFVSERFEHLFGVPPTDLIGQEWFQPRVTNFDEESWRHLHEDVAARRPFRNFRYERPGRDHRIHHIATSGKPFFGEAGRFLGYRGTSRDITGEVEAARARDQFLTALNSVPVEVALYDAEDRLLVFNEKFRQTAAGTLADFLKPGIRFEDMVRHYVSKGAVPEAIGREEEWIAERLERRRRTEIATEVETSAGWIEVSEYRTPDGGTLSILNNITERKRGEAALRESEQRFQDFAGISADWYFETDADLRYTYFSDSMARHGQPPENFLGKSRRDLLGDAHDPEDEHLRVMDAHEPYRNVERRSDFNDDRWLRLSGKPIFSGDGTFLGYRGATTEITDIKRAEEVMRLHAQIVDQIHDSVVSMDLDGHVTSWNKGAERLYGYTTEEALGKPISFVYPEEESEFHAREVVAPFTRKGEHEVDVRMHRKSGEVFDAHLSLSTLTDADGSVIGRIGCAMDITERKKAEEALRESEARFRDFADAASDWLWETDAAGRFTFTTPRFYEVSGLTRDELIGKTRKEVFDANYTPGEASAGDDWQPHFSILENREPFRDLEIDFDRPDGAHRVFLSNGKPIHDAAGDFLGYRGASVDITVRKEAERALQTLNEELEQRVVAHTAELREAQEALILKERLATLGQLTATVSHELRNPLGAMRTSTHVLRQSAGLFDDMQRRALERVERGISRCDGIIDELLDFARIQKLERHAVEIDPWLEALLDEQAPPEDVVLHRQMSLSGYAGSIDPDRLRRAVINVYENACQAMDDAERRHLTVGTCAGEERIEIFVADTGPGITDEVLARIFEPLFSTKNFGVGLGLPTVRQIMEQHGGGVEVETDQGRGTRFVLWLPREAEEGRGEN